MPKPGELTFVAPRGAKPPRHLADLSPAERKEAVAELGEQPFRAKQLSNHYFGRMSNDPASWTDIPAASREKLTESLLPELMSVVRHVSCDDDATRKTLWKLFDGTLVESVLMRYPDRVTMCISSQAGCGMNCPFCATGQAGLTRNLSTAEIVEQIAAGMRSLKSGEFGGQGESSSGDGSGPGGEARLSNVVFMGMGEPLANYNRVLASIRRLTDPAPDGFGLSQRGITVSTVGLVPAMHRFADEGLSCRLALSLHAPDDELRDELVPVNTRWKVAEVLDAAWNYAEKSGRRISIEYALIKDINDQAWRADLLGRLIKNHRVHVNLIPLNPTPGSKWTASRPEDEREFVRRLRSYGVPTTVRDTRGQEIDGACGQLAAAG
ncbi:putative dual-specificity RNA methyltransferase RlmN [Kitasatospora xanthocidica]|uniref:23S rRNA (adenine(2503)-C(2))-methyltransferase RlmN n=1 Tax=Kitasatospora xanthocidica TaxID=83382 RepID=UPI00167BFD3A|nr:23S rRNA (adenine(2503)-C(2))-methyltransferase RlmN [Kitasatospora xanthocidica]GHF79479.1 putative dual-specificity RNA methyltransferase RlmN [Kitasatospora xanthocidica]